MDYDIREHTADVEIVGWGETMGGAFAAVADGMAAAICDDWPEAGEGIAVSITAENPEALLFDYLDELIYLRDVRNVLPVNNEATVSRDEEEWTLTGHFLGVPLDRIVGREIKAPTYADMAVTESEAGWRAVVVLDV